MCSTPLRLVQLFAALITGTYPTLASLAFEHRSAPATVQGTSAPSASESGYITALSYYKVSRFLDWAGTGFPDSPSCRWELRGNSASNLVS